jgi:serine/threonine-protein kinase PpkA
MATVYRAVQQSLGRRIAIKILALELNDDTEFADRFKKEGRILAHLSHPNIVTIHDVGVSQDSRIFLSIEYLSGGTLKDRIKQGLSIDSTFQIIKAIAKALSFAHQNGVIHRDVKPSNIMFRYDGVPVLTDFGVARTIGAKTVHTAAGFIVGSPGYMSPEQAMGESATIQSDLYGLGVVLYEMLIKRPPYQADNSLTIILKHLNDPIPKLPDQYIYLQPIINKLLAKKAAERYKNADEFLDAIDLIIPGNLRIQSKTKANDDQGILEFVSGKIQRRFSKKRPQFLIWTGSIGIAFLAIIIVGYSFKSTTKMAENTQLPQESVNPVEKPAPTQLPTKIVTPLKIEQDQQQDLQLQAQQLLIQAQSNFQENVLENSSAHIEKGLLSVPNHPELLALRERVRVRMVERQREVELRQKQEEEARRQAEIADRQKAEQARQQAKEAQQRAEADQYLARALNYQRNGEYTASLQQIEKGLAAVPNHTDLLRLKEQVLIEASAAQQKEAIRRQAAKVAKEKEPTPRKPPRTPPAVPVKGEDDAAKKLQDIRNSIDALDRSLNR